MHTCTVYCRQHSRPHVARAELSCCLPLASYPGFPSFCPAVGMFVSGHLGDRVDLRYFLTGGPGLLWARGGLGLGRYILPSSHLKHSGFLGHPSPVLAPSSIACNPLSSPRPLQAAWWAAACVWRCLVPPTSGRSTPCHTSLPFRWWEVSKAVGVGGGHSRVEGVALCAPGGLLVCCRLGAGTGQAGAYRQARQADVNRCGGVW